MIEETVKSVRRKQTVDDAYLEKLFDNVTALYRLDQISGQQGGAGGKKDLGPLPGEAVVLLASLGAIWGILGVIAITEWVKQRQKRQN